MTEEPNIEQLKLLGLSLSQSVDALKRRWVVGAITASLNAGLRIKLLRGFRGLGKTTAMLQALSQTEKAMYFSADNPSIKKSGIYTTAQHAIRYGHTTLFIDEIHTYPDWKQELKALHDEHPSIRIVASGSAPLALIPERREELICLHAMNLSEYVFLKNGETIVAKDEWKNKEETMHFIAAHPGIETAFYQYVRIGGFPLSLTLEERTALDAIYYSIKKSIREDAVFFLKLSKEKVFAMENLLHFLATSKPGELSVTSLSSTLGVSKTTVYEIIDALNGMEIIRVIRPYAKGGALARAEPKLLFFHPNMRFAVCAQLGKSAEAGAVREEAAVFGFSERGWTVHTVKGEKKSPDYIIEKGGERLAVEIGGEGKTRKQLKGFKGMVIREYQLTPLLSVGKSSKNS